MKKIIAVVFTLVPLLSYGSKWVNVAKSDTVIFYVDTQSIQKNGNTVTYWEKRNYVKRDEFGDLSSKVNLTINCRTRESQMLYLMTYDDLDNYGKVQSNFSPKNLEWRPIAPDTVSEIVMKFICRQ